MANWLYSASTLFGILLIGGSLALQILYIKNNQASDDYFPHQVASVVLDTIVVGYLMTMLIFYRPYAGSIETGLAVSLLMVGLGVEILSTQWDPTYATTIGGYFLASMNSIIRLYILVQTRCETPRSTVGQIIKEVVEVAKTTGRPVSEVARQVSEPLGSIDIENAYRNAMGILSSAMDKRPETSEEKAEFRTKLKQVFGKETKGGRR